MSYDSYLMCPKCKELVAAGIFDKGNDVLSFLHKHKDCCVNYWHGCNSTEPVVHFVRVGDILNSITGGYKSLEECGWSMFEKDAV